MPAQNVQAQYETLEKISRQFLLQHDAVKRAHAAMQDQIEVLRRGGWVADSATDFYRDMDNNLMPGIARLFGALNEASQITLQIKQLFEAAEQEAAGHLRVTGSTLQSGDPARWPSNAQKTLERLDSGGNIPVYHLNLNDPNASVDSLVKQIPNSEGRPVIALVHGWHVSDAEAKSAFIDTQKWYEAKYGNLPENQRPILIGVDWNSKASDNSGLLGDAGNYLNIQQRATATGDKLGAVLASYQRDNPTALMGITAHSMGNVVATNAIEGHNLHLTAYMAVEGVARSEDLTKTGALSDVVNPNHVGTLYATHSESDLAMDFRPDNSATNHPIGAVEIQPAHKNIYNVDLSGTGGFIGHHSFDPNASPEVAKLTETMFGTAFLQKTP